MRWFLATDSLALRQQARAAHGGKLVTSLELPLAHTRQGHTHAAKVAGVAKADPSTRCGHPYCTGYPHQYSSCCGAGGNAHPGASGLTDPSADLQEGGIPGGCSGDVAPVAVRLPRESRARLLASVC